MGCPISREICHCIMCADDEETCEGEGLGECDDGLDEGDEDESSDGELDEGVDEDNGEDYEDELADKLYGISF
jgi:hypothetical protein